MNLVIRMTDYEINKNAKLLPITEVAKKVSLTEDNLIPYGKYMAKIEGVSLNKKGKLILVTSTNPTPLGEGKTTLAIGLCDALNKNGYQAILALREPSLGPVFGTKGGATGGGMTQVAPMNEINLHFTGDIHAITAANNLIASIIDNHIYQGNKLEIAEVYFQRCLDINDRALREVDLGSRKDHFTITAASEIMAIFTLATSLEDLKKKIDNILIGKNKKGEDVYLKSLNCSGAVVALLKDAFKPNLVQTLENNPAIIHGGPFANIAHGCNSIVATLLAMSLSDYTITEAGFGSDMGAVKFFDIKCDLNGIYPDLVVINATIRSLKYHGDSSLEKGLENLQFHILNMQKFNDNILVILNRFASDTEEEIKIVEDYCKKLKVEVLVSNMYQNGSKDTLDIAKRIVEKTDRPNKKYYHIYDLNDRLTTKIDKFCKDIYHAKEVVYKDNLKEEIDKLDEKYQHYKICISKTPASITDDKNLLGYPKDFKMTVTGYKINNGAGFVTILMGNVITMPGLSKKANYLNIDVVGDDIIGIF